MTLVKWKHDLTQIKLPIGKSKYDLDQIVLPHANCKYDLYQIELAVSMVSEIELERQERGVELEYRVVALNKVGNGPPSATVRAVL